MVRDQLTLTHLARVGFADLGVVRERLAEAHELGAPPAAELLPLLEKTASPDAALTSLLSLLRQSPAQTQALLGQPASAVRLLRVLGASTGLAEFFQRHPAELAVLAASTDALPGPAELTADLLEAVQARDGFASLVGEEAWVALRVRYRRRLAEIAAFDLEQADPVGGVDRIADALADLASAALDAALAVARSMCSGQKGAFGVFPVADVRGTRLAVIGMGKAGARELNYVSDVDVIFVAEGTGPPAGTDAPEPGPDEPPAVSNGRAVDIGTRLAMLMMRGIQQPAAEPELWEVDPNLRPEGKDGALVRTLESHLAYYERWAKSWEFQALLKARPLAGDRELGERYVAAVAPKVWSSASRANFVESVQRMRERVTENIPPDEVGVQLKLGPGGLRDIEFTVQLLQLVHGQADESVRQRGTLPALDALVEGGYIGRAEAADFARDYRILRLMEHRLQLEKLRRTHLVPRDEDELRVLARSTRLAPSAAELLRLWNALKLRVRGLHERLFYRPLLSAVAALPAEELNLTSAQAEARLAAIGFQNTANALSHIRALTAGVSRRASIQRHLLPVMLQWFSEGADPDYGLLAFRRLSDALGSTHWFLRMLRDSSGAASRLTRVLSGSRFVGELLEKVPEAVAWLEDPKDLRPRSRAGLADEARAVVARHESADAVAGILRTFRRREVLRLAFSAILGELTIEELGRGLSDIANVYIAAVLAAIRGVGLESTASPGHVQPAPDGIQFAVIGMGRFGGEELGLGSDADVMYVFRNGALEGEAAHSRAQSVVRELNRLTDDPALPLDLDIGLRPEGKNGVTVRSLDSYAAYYRRWSLTWEAQALLRARGVAGDAALLRDFEALADAVRYPAAISEHDIREVKRIKARVENERLPQGADRTRHLKLGRGSLSDVEWFVQLLQLQHAADLPQLQTTSTLTALAEATAAGLVSEADAATLRAAWIFASRVRSAITLWTNKTSDVLPVDRLQLEGIARVLGFPPGSANRLDEEYLALTRRARVVFENRFYGPPEHPAASAG